MLKSKTVQNFWELKFNEKKKILFFSTLIKKHLKFNKKTQLHILQ